MHDLDVEQDLVDTPWPALCRSDGRGPYGALDRTWVLFLGHVTSPNVIVLPVAELVRRAREAGQFQRVCHEPVCTARRAVAELTGLPPITPDAPGWFA